MSIYVAVFKYLKGKTLLFYALFIGKKALRQT